MLALHNCVPGKHGFACVLGLAVLELTRALRVVMQFVYPDVSDHRVVHGLNQLCQMHEFRTI